MISGIGGGSTFMDFSQVAAMRGQMGNPFKEIDSNGDGSLDSTEIASFADKISEVTGQSVDADQLFSELDTDENGLISQEEFDAGRPEGPPPAMMGGMPAGGMQNMLNGTEDEDSSGSTDPLDINGDGIVDAEEAKLAGNSFFLNYMGLTASASNQDNEKNSLLNLLV